MNNLNHLQIQSESVYANKCKKYGNLEKLFDEKLDFDNFCYNAFLHYLKQGEVTHLNRVLNAAKHVNRYRETRAILRPLTAHRWTSGPAPILDAESKAQKKKLRYLRENGENDFLMTFSAEQGKQQASREFTREKLQQRLKRLVKAANEAGFGLDVIQNELIDVDTEMRKSRKSTVRKVA